MTSSATQTERRRRAKANAEGKGTGKGKGKADAKASEATAEERATVSLATAAHVVLGAIGVGGILFIFWFHDWYYTWSVFFLCLGWVGVLVAARSLFMVAWSAVDDTEDDEDFWRPVGELDELRREKLSLLKAIKEIEFDFQLGKMSEEDATRLTKLYRGRAIEIIKAIETVESGAGKDGEDGPEDAPVKRAIERELKARLKVAGVSRKAKRRAGKKKGKGKGKSKSGPEETSKSESESDESKAEPESESDESKAEPESESDEAKEEAL